MPISGGYVNRGHYARYTQQAGEKAWTFVPQTWRYNQAKRGIIFCHGAGQDASVGAALGTVAEKTGAVITCPDLNPLGNLFAWGNQLQIDLILAEWEVLKSQYNVKPDKMVLYGLSMGGATAIICSLEVGTGVCAGVYTEVPAIYIDDIHNNDRLGQEVAINFAYGGNPFDSSQWDFFKPVRDPYLSEAAHNTEAIPTFIFYGGADPVCLPAFTEHYAANVANVTAVNMGAGVGHDVTLVDVDRRAAFLYSVI